MDIPKKIELFNQRWKIQDESEYKKKFNQFRTAALNIFENVDDVAKRESCKRFCNINGLPFEWKGGGYTSEGYSTNILDALNNETDEIKFYYLLQTIFWLPITGIYRRDDKQIDLNYYFSHLKELSDIFGVNLALTRDSNKEVILFPRGEEKLDRELIDKVFSFLNQESNEKFKEALRFYEERKFIKSAESIRRCLEEFLRFKLKNTQGLDKNIDNLANALKSKSVPIEIRNLIKKDFDYLDKFFNPHSKHGDGNLSEAESEYLLYQCAVLMRYVSKIIS